MKKISLYLGGALFNKIDGLRAIYLFEGSGVSDAPEISEVIEGLISWFSYYLYADPDEIKISEKFVVNAETILEEHNKKTKLTGRVFFPLYDYTEQELEKIRKKLGTNESDAILIRNILKRIFYCDSKSNIWPEFVNFVSRTYLEYMYGLSLRSSFFTSLASRNMISIKELRNKISDDEFKKVKEILLDQGKIKKLETGVGIISLGNLKTKKNFINPEKKEEILGMKLDAYYNDYDLLNSSSYYFNYYDLYLSYMFIFNFWSEKKYMCYVPDFLQCFLFYEINGLYTQPAEYFFEELENLLNLSIKINEETLF